MTNFSAEVTSRFQPIVYSSILSVDPRSMSKEQGEVMAGTYPGAGNPPQVRSTYSVGKGTDVVFIAPSLATRTLRKLSMYYPLSHKIHQ